MTAVRETFASSDPQAIARLDNAYAKGQLPWVSKPYWKEGWFGRGLVQLTHLDNYRRMGERLKIDLVGNRDLTLDLAVSSDIIVIGMNEGLFRKHKLADYIKDGDCDYIGARQIVNPDPNGNLIAGYADAFETALLEGRKHPEEVTEAKDVETTEKPVSTTQIAGGVAAVAAIAAPAVEIVENVNSVSGQITWQTIAVIGLALVGAAACAWIIKERRRHARENGI
jgi:hypothetical protein